MTKPRSTARYLRVLIYADDVRLDGFNGLFGSSVFAAVAKRAASTGNEWEVGAAPAHCHKGADV